jgi:glycosyltransferase involved in cell wall biosynthesis
MVRAQRSVVVADANWYSTENLFSEFEEPATRTLLLKCVDYVNALHRGLPPWRWRGGWSRLGERTWQREHILPSGWMKRFPRLGMRPIERSIRRWHATEGSEGRQVLLMTYPHYLYLRDLVQPDASIYYNIDDYTQYWPRAAAQVSALERSAVLESDLTVCVSRLRCEELRNAVPAAAHRIHHLPHGAPRNVLRLGMHVEPAAGPNDLRELPRPILGYVGTLEDRVDWSLLDRLAEDQPSGSLVLIGKLGPDGRGDWLRDRARCLARPNVHLLGWRTQEQIAAYTTAFDVCLIPYRTDHPFNRVCSPTKIMDYLATGRPIVATAIPECLLYQPHFDVVEGVEEYLQAVARLLALGGDDGRAALRYAYAQNHSCQATAVQLLDWLGD